VQEEWWIISVMKGGDITIFHDIDSSIYFFVVQNFDKVREEEREK
jgi:hypothetical protein